MFQNILDTETRDKSGNHVVAVISISITAQHWSFLKGGYGK